MRTEFEQNQNYESTKGARTESEFKKDSTIFGFDALKIAKFINFVSGTALSVVMGLSIFDIFKVGDFFEEIGLILLNFY